MNSYFKSKNKVNTLIIRSSIALFGFFFALCPGHAMAQTINFSGTWKIDKEKTSFGNLTENSAPVQLRVDQKEDTVSIERTSTTQAGDTHSYNEKLPFNGNKVTIAARSDVKKNASIKWSADGQMLTETADYLDYTSKVSYKVTEIWTLSNDKQTLNIVRTDEGDDGKFNMKCVYERVNP